MNPQNNEHYLAYYQHGGDFATNGQADAIILTTDDSVDPPTRVAFVTPEAFKRLASYDSSMPTGPKPGRVWKSARDWRDPSAGYHLAHVREDEDPEYVLIDWYVLRVTEEQKSQRFPLGTRVVWGSPQGPLPGVVIGEHGGRPMVRLDRLGSTYAPPCDEIVKEEA